MITHSFYFKIDFILLIILLFGTVKQSLAQTPQNPFELTPRIIETPATGQHETELEESDTNPFELTRENNTEDILKDTTEFPPTKEETTITSSTDNPFEIVTSPADNIKVPTEISSFKKVATPTPVSPIVNTRLLNGVIFFILVLLAVLASLFRSALTKSIHAFLNDNLLGQIYREQISGLTFPYVSLYILFLLNAGVFVFLLLKYFGISLLPEQYSGILGTILVVSGILLLKLLILWLISKIYPIEKETNLYSFTVIIFSIICGLILIPANILLAYASADVVHYTIYGVAAILGLIYLLRTLRGIIIANRFLLFHKFHFLLYICTIEIAPVIILLKFI
ncbi:MAG: DUF4271 domain-containing protein [Saprospiraceae bacterium]